MDLFERCPLQNKKNAQNAHTLPATSANIKCASFASRTLLREAVLGSRTGLRSRAGGCDLPRPSRSKPGFGAPMRSTGARKSKISTLTERGSGPGARRWLAAA